MFRRIPGRRLNLLKAIICLREFDGKGFDIVAEFEVGSATSFGFRVLKNATGTEFTSISYDATTSKLCVDRTKSGNTAFHPSFAVMDEVAMPPIGNEIKMRILVDWSSVEVFGNDGEIVLSYQVFPYVNSNKLELFASGGEVRLVSLTINTTKSIWQ